MHTELEALAKNQPTCAVICVILRSLVSVDQRNVCDGRTDRLTDRNTMTADTRASYRLAGNNNITRTHQEMR